ncbi:MAG: NADPH-dependent FMN reductase [Hyphomicrobiaceae bacterium]
MHTLHVARANDDDHAFVQRFPAMPHTMKLLFLAGSAREGSYNKKLARLGAEIAHANGILSTFADLGDYPMPIYDGDVEANTGPPENAAKLKALMQLHHGIFIASPEYNSSIAPLLKNTLDWISRVKGEGEVPSQVYKTRVFALGAASPGAFGGVRGMPHVRQVLELGLGALVLPDQILVPRAMEAFEDNGHLKDKGAMEMYKGVIQKLARAAHFVSAPAT